MTLNRDRASLLDALHSFVSLYVCICIVFSHAISLFMYYCVFRFVPHSVFGSLIHDWPDYIDREQIF